MPLCVFVCVLIFLLNYRAILTNEMRGSLHAMPRLSKQYCVLLLKMHWSKSRECEFKQSFVLFNGHVLVMQIWMFSLVKLSYSFGPHVCYPGCFWWPLSWKICTFCTVLFISWWGFIEFVKGFIEYIGMEWSFRRRHMCYHDKDSFMGLKKKNIKRCVFMWFYQLA